MVLVSYRPINTIVLVGLIVMVTHFLHADSKCATLPGTEESMTTTSDWSCTRWLRIIVLPWKHDTMPPLHQRIQGANHDSTLVLLPLDASGTPVAVCHAARCLAQPRRRCPAATSHLYPTTASTRQRASTVCRTDPETSLCLV